MGSERSLCGERTVEFHLEMRVCLMKAFESLEVCVSMVDSCVSDCSAGVSDFSRWQQRGEDMGWKPKRV